MSGELTKEEREELEKLQKEILDEAKKVVNDYIDNPSEISGSTINIHQNSPFLDEDNKACPQATLWLSGNEYKADEDGLIVVPFSNRPGRQTIVLRNGNFSALASFIHQKETYSLDAGIYVDREALVCNITRAFAHQIFCDGFYSADPHPGNILVDRLGG